MPSVEEQIAPFTLGPPPAKAHGSVVLLHGFTGTPWEMRVLGESLAARGYHVTAPRLPGHGVHPEAMLYVSWRDWLACAEDAVLGQETREVDVVGLSMGALLGLLIAARWPERVRRLALLAPVMRLRGVAPRALRVLQRAGLAGFDRWLRKRASDIEDPHARAEAPLLPRYPLSRLGDLLTLQAMARASASQVRAPTLLALAENDHVVDARGVEWLHRTIRTSSLIRFQRGHHIITRDVDRARVIDEVATFLDSS